MKYEDRKEAKGGDTRGGAMRNRPSSSRPTDAELLSFLLLCSLLVPITGLKERHETAETAVD
jgi:hypothetical protein